MGSRFQLHVHWWGIHYHDKLSHIEISWLKGGYPQFTPLPLGNFARLTLAVHQCPFSTQECTPGWKMALWEWRVFPISTTQSSSQCLYVCLWVQWSECWPLHTWLFFSHNCKRSWPNFGGDCYILNELTMSFPMIWKSCVCLYDNTNCFDYIFQRRRRAFFPRCVHLP